MHNDPAAFVDMASRVARGESAPLGPRIECEAKFALAPGRDLAAELTSLGFSAHEPRHELDLFLAPIDAAAPFPVKLRFSGELNRLSLIVKLREEHSSSGDEPFVFSRIAWREYPANHPLLPELRAAGLEARDAIAKQRRVFTKGAVSACLDRIGGLGRFVEIGAFAHGESATALRAAAHALEALPGLGAPIAFSYLELARRNNRG